MRGKEQAHSPVFWVEFCFWFFFLPKASLNHGHGLGDEVSQAPRLTSLLLPPVPHCETDSFWFGSVSKLPVIKSKAPPLRLLPQLAPTGEPPHKSPVVLGLVEGAQRCPSNHQEETAVRATVVAVVGGG